MEQSFVIFLSPGAFFSEQTERPIDSWDIEQAKAIAAGMVQGHNARPYGFKFVTRRRKDDEIIKQSGVYYLGGKLRTLEQVEADNLPNEEILRWNMRENNYSAVIENTNSWKFTAPFNKEDVLLDFTMLAPQS